MLCVVTLWVFFPSLTSPPVVCPSSEAAHTTSSVPSSRRIFMRRILRRSLAVLTDGDDENDGRRAEQNQERLRDFGRPRALHQNRPRNRHEVTHRVDHRDLLHPRR